MNAIVLPTLPSIGTEMEGGYFGGIINVNGMHKGVIWAPKKEGQITSIVLPTGHRIEGGTSAFDCTANMEALLKAGSPAAQQIEALEINGTKGWLFPSRDVLELGYRHFKPTSYENYCSWRDGENANSVPPGWLYTPDMPAQTSLVAFQDGGEEAFDEDWYVSSTVLPSGKTAFFQHFSNGIQVYNHLSAECRVRAVKLIPL